MGQTTTVIPTGGGGAKVQDTEPTNPSKGDLWVDTSVSIPATKWYSGTSWERIEARVLEGGLTEHKPPQISYNSKTLEYEKSHIYDLTLATDSGNSIAESGTNYLIAKPDGTRLYTGEGEYKLTEPWDLSTAIEIGNDVNASAFDIHPDGTKYWSCSFYGPISEFVMSEPWDLSTATSTGNEYSRKSGDRGGFRWANNGRILVEGGASDNTLYQHEATTPYDITTLSYTGKSFDAPSAPTPLMKPDGTRMYISSQYGGYVRSYTLSDAFDISTATYSGNELSHNRASGLVWSESGDRIIVSAGRQDAIRQYDIPYQSF